MPAPLVGAAVAAIPKVIDLVAGIFQKKAEGELTETQAKAEVDKVMALAMAEIETTYRAELDLQREVMVAELQQGDAFTKRARPSIVYVGLGIVAFSAIVTRSVGVYAVWQLLSGEADLAATQATTEAVRQIMSVPVADDFFWAAWGGVASFWVVGRTRERAGSEPGRIMRLIYGEKAKE